MVNCKEIHFNNKIIDVIVLIIKWQSILHLVILSKNQGFPRYLTFRMFNGRHFKNVINIFVVFFLYW